MYESYKINTKNYCIIFIMYDFRFLRCSCVATLEKSNNEADYLQREDISEWRQIQNHYYSKIRRCTTRQYFAPSFLPWWWYKYMKMRISAFLIREIWLRSNFTRSYWSQKKYLSAFNTRLTLLYFNHSAVNKLQSTTITSSPVTCLVH